MMNAGSRRTLWVRLLVLCMVVSFFAPAAGYASETGDVETELIDLSHENPTDWGFTLGNKDEVKRWQTFTPRFDGSLVQIGLYLVEKIGEGDLSPPGCGTVCRFRRKTGRGTAHVRQRAAGSSHLPIGDDR
jgi:hypothetical protein